MGRRYAIFGGLFFAVAVAALLTGTGGEKKPGASPASRPGGTDANTVTPIATPTDNSEAIRRNLIIKHNLTSKVLLIQFGSAGDPLSDEGLEGMMLHQRLDDVPGLAFLRVETSPDANAANAFYRDNEVKFPVHRDPNSRAAKAFEADGESVFVLVDKFGRIRYRGPEPDERLGEWTEQLQAQSEDAGDGAAMLGDVQLDGAKLLAGTNLPNLQGDVVELKQAMGPEGIVVLLLDTTCPFSGEALRDMPTIVNTLAEARIGSIIINVDGSKDTVAEHYADKDLPTELVYDETDAALKAWNISSVPTVFYIAPDEKIAYNGPAVWADVAQAIEKSRGLGAGTIKFTAEGTEYG